MNAPTLEIYTNEIIAGSTTIKFTIDFRGQNGGRGGKGGNGGDGGNGQKGAKSTFQDSWYNGEECTREPGAGGDGGKGGDAGYPGKGGDGGKGGIVIVFVKKLSDIKNWVVQVKGGKGGRPGNPGNFGKGGKGGPQGDKEGPCPRRDEYRGKQGADGRKMSTIDTDWERNFNGKDGSDGEYNSYKIKEVPK